MSESIRQYIDRTVPPDPQFPRLSRVGAISPADGSSLQWVLHQAHPLSPGFTVMRMFRRALGIKVYSVKDDGTMGLLNFIPRERVLITDEIMGQPILLEELAACEAGEDEQDIDPGDDPDAPDEPDEPDAPETPRATEATPSNGEATS